MKSTQFSPVDIPAMEPQPEPSLPQEEKTSDLRPIARETKFRGETESTPEVKDDEQKVIDEIKNDEQINTLVKKIRGRIVSIENIEGGDNE